MIYLTLYKDQVAQEIENHMNRSSCGLIWDTVLPFAWKDCGNAWKPVRIVGIRIKIWTGYLQHRSHLNQVSGLVSIPLQKLLQEQLNKYHFYNSASLLLRPWNLQKYYKLNFQKLTQTYFHISRYRWQWHFT